MRLRLLLALTWLPSGYALAASMYGSSTPFEVLGQTAPLGSLLSVSQENGAGTLVGIPGGLSGIAFNSQGQLFGASRLDEAPGPLVRVDPNSGALVETVGAIRNGANDIGISDLAFQPGTDVLFGISTSDVGNPCLDCLYTIDTQTAVATLVGQPDVLKGGGLAFAPDGTLYLVTTFSHSGDTFDPLFELVTLDPNDASVLSREDALLEVPQEVRGLTIRSVRFDGLGVRPADGALFATQGGGALEIYQRVILPQGPRWRLLGESSASMTDLDFRPSAGCPDGDEDGVCDAQDNCPHTPNADQGDAGGVGPLSDPDGIGDACQCGNAAGDDGFVLANDVALLRQKLSGAEVAISADLCNVHGAPGSGPGTCAIDDVVVTRRALEGLAPGIAAVCAAALP